MSFAWRSLILIALAAPMTACGQGSDQPGLTDTVQEQREAAAAKATAAKGTKAACASTATYDRLKQIVFDEAIKRRGGDAANLDQLSTYSLVRVENPVVRSRDEVLDITVCAGRFVLQLPPGVEQAFDGKRLLSADIEYDAQAAADGSGLVYRVRRAEPIVASLAAFNLRAQAYRPTAAPARSAREPEAGAPTLRPASPAPAPAPVPAPVPAPAPGPNPVRENATETAEPAEAYPAPRPAPPVRTPDATRNTSPSFNCRAGRSRSEQLVCNSSRLSALDRAMSSQFYAEMDRGDRAVRAELRRTRDRFLGTRGRCRDEACVEQTYRDRMAEIDAIATRR